MTTGVKLHVFCSAKGGVGKSTLAVACAKLIAATPGRVCVLVDADFTGTSLADGLDLRAPKTHIRSDGGVDLDVPPKEGFYDVAETRRQRAERRDTKWPSGRRPPPPGYLNDVLIHPTKEPPTIDEIAKEIPLATVFWRHERKDGVFYLPSSPLPRDVEIALGWLYNEKPFSWLARMSWMFDAMTEPDQVSGLTDIVVDCPPGLFGFAHEMVVLASFLSQPKPLPIGYPKWHETKKLSTAVAYLVTSQDRNDLRVAAEYFAKHRHKLPTLVPLLNRRTEDSATLQDVVRDQVGDIGAAEALTFVSEMAGSLGKVFVSRDLALSSEIQGLRDLFVEGKGS